MAEATGPELSLARTRRVTEIAKRVGREESAGRAANVNPGRKPGRERLHYVKIIRDFAALRHLSKRVSAIAYNPSSRDATCA
ncbi:hypothetical protein [Pandoraea sp.]|uniref:hypothetical protein n=1 Tax=Pandoraea sp. TaxID=1883445 RepID=UPI0035AE2E7D